MIYAMQINSKYLNKSMSNKKTPMQVKHPNSKASSASFCKHIATLAATSIYNTKIDTVIAKENPNYSKITCIKLYK